MFDVRRSWISDLRSHHLFALRATRDAGSSLPGFSSSRKFRRSSLRESARVTVVAGEILVDGVEMEELVAFGAELLELFAAALGQDRVAGVAIAGLDAALAVGRFVLSVMAAEAARPILVAGIVRI